MPTDARPKAYLLDLDGTLYANGAAIPGALQAIARLRAMRIPFRCVTNATSRPRATIVDRLHQYGFDIAPSEVFTATLAGAELARARGHRRIAAFLPDATLEDLRDFELVDCPSAQPADAVLLGDLGDAWNYVRLQEAFEHLMAGAELIALSRDRYWQRGDALALDSGPFVAALEYATSKSATIAGKPSATFFAAALASLGSGVGEGVGRAAMVGDDLWSDVEGAQRAGLQGWLVRTGKFRVDAFSASGIHPDRVLASIADLEA